MSAGAYASISRYRQERPIQLRDVLVVGQGGAVGPGGRRYFTETWHWFATQTLDWFVQAARKYMRGIGVEEREQRAYQVAGQAQLLLRRDFAVLGEVARCPARRTPYDALAPLIERYVRQVVHEPQYRPWAIESTRGVQIIAPPSKNNGDESAYEDTLVVGEKVRGSDREPLTIPRPIDLARREDANALALLRRYQPAMARAAELVLSGSSYNRASQATGVARDSIPRILTQIQSIRDYGVLNVGNKLQAFTRLTPGYREVLQWLETEWGRLGIGANNTIEAIAIARGLLAGGKLYKWLLCQRCVQLRDPNAIYRLLRRQPGCQGISPSQLTNKMAHAAKVFRDEYARRNGGQSPLDTTPGLREIEDARRGSKGRRWSLLESRARVPPAPAPVRLMRPEVFDYDGWRSMTFENLKVSPADQAAFNVDFQNWLSSYDLRSRSIISHLAAGERTNDVAEHFGTTPGRVSYLRHQFEQSWQKYQGNA